MANTDQKGNKIAQDRPKKSVAAANRRMRRAGKGWNCPDCGYHVRGENHAEGLHHRKGAKRNG